jgi:NB-ARC domain
LLGHGIPLQRRCDADILLGYNLGLHLGDAPELEASLFIGRAADLDSMKNNLQPDAISNTRSVLVLGGMGGVGKTQLAIAYAMRNHTSYTSIFWLNATSETTVKSSLRQLARRIIAPGLERKSDDEMIHVWVSSWLSEQDNSRWLLIFDNHDEPEQYDITKFYPYASHGSIIVTTRSPEMLLGEKMRVLPMSDEKEGMSILESRSGRTNLIAGMEVHCVEPSDSITDALS